MAFLAAMNAQDGKKADFAASKRGWTTDCHASSKQSMIDPGGTIDSRIIHHSTLGTADADGYNTAL